MVTFGLPNISRGTPINKVTDLRRPNDHEVFYQYIAFEFNAPKLCEKISSDAFLTVGIPGKAAYVKSECFYNIAKRYGNENICQQVIRFKGKHGNRHISDRNCRKELRKHGIDETETTYSPSEKFLSEALIAFGYSIEAIDDLNVIPQLISYRDAYNRLDQKKDLIKRITQLDAATNNRKIVPQQLEYLYDLAAHASNNAAWCTKIRDHVKTPDSKYSKNSKTYFRDQCIMEVASNAKKPEFCNLIPNRPEYTPTSYSTKYSCHRQTDPSFQSTGHYGYLIPSHDRIMIELMKILKYPLPTEKDIPQYVRTNLYHGFIFEISDNLNLKALEVKHNPKLEEIQKNIIEKTIRTLPDYS
jgi:hypothetical protein